MDSSPDGFLNDQERWGHDRFRMADEYINDTDTNRPLRPEKPYYKPIGLRTPWLIFLAAATAAILGVLEYINHELPDRTFFAENDAEVPTYSESPVSSTTDPVTLTQSTTDPVTLTQVVYLVTETTTYTPYYHSPATSFPAETTTYEISVDVGETPWISGSILSTATVTETVTINQSAAPSLYFGGDPKVTAAMTTITESMEATMTASAFFWKDLTDSTSETVSEAASPTAKAVAAGDKSEGPKIFFVSDKPLVPILWSALYLPVIYLPIIVAIVIRLLIGFTYTNLRKMEPFYLLSREEGASAREVFGLDYLHENSSFGPLKALLSRRWLALVTSLAYAATQLITPFASELIVIKDSEYRGGPMVTRASALWLNSTVCRLLEVLLGLILLLLVCMWLLMRFQQAKVYSDPSSIAGIASLLSHRGTTEHLKRIGWWKQDKETTERLKKVNLYLGSYSDANGTIHNGLTLREEITASTSIDSDVPSSTEVSYKYRPSRFARHIEKSMFFVVLGGLLALITYYRKLSTNNRFEQFMDSNRFGPRFMMIIFGMIIQFQWTRLARIRAINDPFWTLLRSNTQTKTTQAFLQRRDTEPVSLFFLSVYYGTWTTALVAFMAVLSEILIIMLAGIPLNRIRTQETYDISTFFSITILSLMLGVTVFVWIVEPSRPWPFEPSGIGAMMHYLTWSGVPQDMADTSLLGTAERDKMVKSWRRGYRVSNDNGAWTMDYDDVSTVTQIMVDPVKGKA